MRNLLLTWGFLLSAFVSNAKDYYVDASTLSSVQNGSLTTPWKTLYQVSSNQSLFQPGDFVLFKRGGNFTGTFFPTRGGTAAAPLTFGAYGTGDKPKFTGTGSKIGYLVYVNDKSYIIFRDWCITDPSIDNADRKIDSKIQRAFTFDSKSVGCKIISCDISLVGVAAYWIGGGHTMDSCNVGNLRMVVDTDQGYQPGNDDDYGANPLVISSANNTVIHNYFHDCWANSFDYDFDGGAIEFYGSGTNNNFIAYNTIVDCIGLSEITGNSSNNTYAYNKIINNGSLFYFQSRYTYSGFNFYNNVIIENRAPRVNESRLIGGSITTGAVILKNNIFQLSNGVDVAGSANGLAHENNIYKLSNNSLPNFPLNKSELSTTADLWKDAKQTEPVAWNFDLIDKSPALEFGLDVGQKTDFRGQPVGTYPDAGVYESGYLVTPPSDTVVLTPTNPTVPFISNDANNIYLNTSKQGTYRLYNSFGTIIRSGSYPKGISIIDISRYPSGTYTFRTNQKNYTVKK